MGYTPAWLLAVPIAQLYLLYAYYRAGEQITGTIRGLPVFIAHIALSLFVVLASYDMVSQIISAQTIDSSAGASYSALNPLALPVTVALTGLIVYVQHNYNKMHSGDSFLSETKA